MTNIEKKILKVIAIYSMYSIAEIERGYEIVKSIDILLEALEGAPENNMSLEEWLRW